MSFRNQLFAGYHAPDSVDAALSLLAAHGAAAQILAGGTGEAGETSGSARELIYIGGLKELGRCRLLPHGRLSIGSAMTCAEIASSPLVAEQAPILAEAALSLGGPQIRNQATIGGNVAGRSPHADLVPALLALNGEVCLDDGTGARRVALTEYLAAPAAGALITAIECDVSPPTAAYERLAARRALSPALVSVAVALHVEAESPRWARASIVVGSVGENAVHVEAAGAAIEGAPVAGEAFAEAVEKAAATVGRLVDPRSDAFASAWYRKAMVEVLTSRALRKAAANGAAAP